MLLRRCWRYQRGNRRRTDNILHDNILMLSRYSWLSIFRDVITGQYQSVAYWFFYKKSPKDLNISLTYKLNMNVKTPTVLVTLTHCDCLSPLGFLLPKTLKLFALSIVRPWAYLKVIPKTLRAHWIEYQHLYSKSEKNPFFFQNSFCDHCNTYFKLTTWYRCS
jgi:hypothetical protein